MTLDLSAGDFITATNLLTWSDGIETRLTNLESHNPTCGVHIGSSQTINELTGTALVWDAEDWDVGPMHSGGGTSNELIVPLAGRYRMDLYVVWATHTSGYRKINVRVNSADVTGLGPMDGDGTEPLQMQCATEVFCDVGATVKGFVYYDSGGATATLDVIGARMTATYLGGVTP